MLARRSRHPSPGRRAFAQGSGRRLARLQGVPVVAIHYRGDRDLSQAGRAKIRALLERTRGDQEKSMLGLAGFCSRSRAQVLSVARDRLATPSQVAGSRIGRLLTVFLVMFLLTGGSVVAIDIVAGEKERGSLETLLTTAAGRGRDRSRQTARDLLGRTDRHPYPARQHGFLRLSHRQASARTMSTMLHRW